ncbi:MAG: hypothetical protein LBG60_03210 [Bifidobacteriaceae bacterium]|jgi:uroporphyrinogen decarboxylase|nr:hypothetical protein [Bifidobacteriaceae bacterium]
MRPQDRIQAVLCRSSADRLPVDLWCTPEVLDALREHTGLDDELAVYDALGLDKIVWVFPGYGGRYFDPNDAGETTLWGVRTRRVRSGLATYDEYVGFPLAGMEEAAQLDGHPWPEPEMFDYAASTALADRARCL